jgi:excisionase family DNA binding protein
LSQARAPSAIATAPATEILTAAEAAKILRVSVSFLAKARMHGNGPAFMKVGRSVRYTMSALQQWMKSKQRLSTSER